MTHHEFRELLRRAVQETVVHTRLYVLDLLPDECWFRCHTLLPMWEMPLLGEDEVIEALWSGGRVPDEIRIIVASVEEGRTVVHLLHSRVYIDPISPEWEENWASISEGVRVFYPFLIRIPRPPTGWRIVVNGLPDLARSVAENGKYPLSSRPPVVLTLPPAHTGE
jgi:hypothetical protein